MRLQNVPQNHRNLTLSQMLVLIHQAALFENSFWGMGPINLFCIFTTTETDLISLIIMTLYLIISYIASKQINGLPGEADWWEFSDG